MGLSLVDRLLGGCLDRGIEPRTSCCGLELIMADGQITGMHCEGPDGPFSLRARSVILATGGFEWNPNLLRAFTRGLFTYPVSIQTNTGDGLKWPCA